MVLVRPKTGVRLVLAGLFRFPEVPDSLDLPSLAAAAAAAAVIVIVRRRCCEREYCCARRGKGTDLMLWNTTSPVHFCTWSLGGAGYAFLFRRTMPGG